MDEVPARNRLDNEVPKAECRSRDTRYSVHHWQASNGHPEVSLLDSGREDGDVDRNWSISSPYLSLGSGVWGCPQNGIEIGRYAPGQSASLRDSAWWN